MKNFIFLVAVLFTHPASAQTGWQHLSLGFRPDNILSVNFLNADTGYVSAYFSATQTQTSYRTSDGGNSWSEILMPRGLLIVNPRFGLHDTSIYYTRDAGLTWVASVLPSRYKISAISAPTTDTIFACGGSTNLQPILLRSVNSGKTWDSISTLTNTSEILFKNPCWADGEHGMICSEFSSDPNPTGYQYYTSDAGAHWQKVGTQVESIASLGSGTWVDAIFGNTSMEDISRTTNSGSTWSATTFVSNRGLFCGASVAFYDSTIGYAGTACAGYLYKTTNGGLNWFLQDTTASVGMISAPTVTVAYAVTS